ncbi:MAG: sigma 54-interacting transcriptional regulator, partial [Myxococcota bacterium]|nr:sigma 54-interacting transcriptional regulator [Myxococcota bacterium]
MSLSDDSIRFRFGSLPRTRILDVMGGQTWDTTLKERPRGGATRTIASLRVLAVAGVPRRDPPFPLRTASTPIGRAVADAGLALADPRVSRLHAIVELDIKTGAATILDRSSTGTDVDGELVTTRELEDGALIFVGESALLFRRGPADEDGEELPTWGLLGDAPAIRSLRRAIHRIGTSEASVLLYGESGTGKELAAHALHAASGRRGPLIPVNCSAIPAPLAEAQLFGHLAGSYTGARTAGPGLFRAADGGTIFLDEIADLPAEVQPKLLRVLEERIVTPVGATKGAPVDVRVVAATNRDLLAEVESGRFRGDLYARLSDFTLELPPLRARREDVLTILRRDLADDAPPLAPELVRALLLHDWPFNVRELRKIATQLSVVGAGAARLELEMLGDRLSRVSRAARSPTAPPSTIPPAAVSRSEATPV